MKRFEKRVDENYIDYRWNVTENTSFDFSINRLDLWLKSGQVIPITPYIGFSKTNPSHTARFIIGLQLVFVSLWFEVWKPEK